MGVTWFHALGLGNASAQILEWSGEFPVSKCRRRMGRDSTGQV